MFGVFAWKITEKSTGRWWGVCLLLCVDDVVPPASLTCDEPTLEWFAAECKAAAIRVLCTIKSEAVILRQKEKPWTPHWDSCEGVQVCLSLEVVVSDCTGVSLCVERESRAWSQRSWVTYGHKLQAVTGRMRLLMQAVEVSFLCAVAGLKGAETAETGGRFWMLLQVERNHLSWVRHWIRMPAGHLPLEICPTGQRPWGSPRARLRDYLSHLAMERLGVPQE